MEYGEKLENERYKCYNLLKHFKELYFIELTNGEFNNIVYNLKKRRIYKIKGKICSCLGHGYRDKCKHIAMLKYEYKGSNGMPYNMLWEYHNVLMGKGLPPLPDVNLSDEIVTKVVLKRQPEFYVGLYERRVWYGRVKRRYDVVMYW